MSHILLFLGCVSGKLDQNLAARTRAGAECGYPTVAEPAVPLYAQTSVMVLWQELKGQASVGQQCVTSMSQLHLSDLICHTHPGGGRWWLLCLKPRQHSHGKPSCSLTQPSRCGRPGSELSPAPCPPSLLSLCVSCSHCLTLRPSLLPHLCP